MLDNKKISEKEFVEYFGYKIYADGRVISPHGKVLNAYSLTYPGSHITLKIDKKTVKKNKAILIWNVFHSEQEQVDIYRYVMQFKDGNTYNTALDNLYLVSRKDYYASKSLDGKSKFNDKKRDAIKQEYLDGEHSIRRLCKKYSCSLLTMQKILRDM